MTAITEAGPVPFSQFTGTSDEFRQTLAYEVDEIGFATARSVRRQQGDILLFSLLGGRPLVEFSDEELRAALDQAEEQLAPGWGVYGHDDEPIRERLDRHFARGQVLHVEREELRVRQAEVRERTQDVWHLNQLRNGITRARQDVENTQRVIGDMESDLAKTAERLGEPEWPA